jgi:hypothetical protein
MRRAKAIKASWADGKGALPRHQSVRTSVSLTSLAILAKRRSKLTKASQPLSLRQMKRVREIHAANRPIQGLGDQDRLVQGNGRQTGESMKRPR